MRIEGSTAANDRTVRETNKDPEIPGIGGSPFLCL